MLEADKGNGCEEGPNESTETEIVIPKLTLAIGENGRVRVKRRHSRASYKYQPTLSIGTLGETKAKLVEPNDPYALPVSPMNSELDICQFVSASNEKSSPSPDPPILLPEEEVDQVNRLGPYYSKH